MYRILILLFALLMISGGETAEAARPSAYARAKMSGRMFTHRPNYKLYKGRKKKKLLHFGKTSRSKAKYSPKRAGRL